MDVNSSESSILIFTFERSKRVKIFIDYDLSNAIDKNVQKENRICTGLENDFRGIKKTPKTFFYKM